MKVTSWVLGLGLALGFVSADSAPTCGDGKTCPQNAPCCSQYGECGTGLNCLAACDVRHSFNRTSCVGMPVCQNADYKFTDDKSIGDQSKYLGNSSEYAWTTNGKVVSYDGNVLLTMANQSYGTVISSTNSVWYGKVSATLKTSHGNGVVSAFILMSGSKDEVDYEFVGSNVDQAQSNFYWQGFLNYTNGGTASLSSTNDSFHTYELDWQENKIEWLIDGQVIRTLNKADTYNATSKIYQFPQTPSIVQLSLWPGGSSLNAEGTVSWAGGPINWNMPEFSDPGYLYVTLKEISIECYDPPSGVKMSGKSTYVYADDDLLESSVQITDDTHILDSPEAVGFNPSKGKGNKSLLAVSQMLATEIGAGHGSGSATSSGSLLVASGVQASSSTSAKATKSTDSTASTASTASTEAASTGSDSQTSGSSSESQSDASSTSTNTGFKQGNGASTSASSNGGSVSRSDIASGMAGLLMLLGMYIVA